jgi:nucleoside-diphosphate-sugar epimerase
VITGGLGRVAQRLIPALSSHYQLRLLDRKEPSEGPHLEHEYVQEDLTHSAAVSEVLRDAAAVVHLAGSPSPRISWNEAYLANIVTTHSVLQAAANTGVPRVVLASSLHAIGEYNRPEYRPVPADAAPRPCCPYGLSKVAVETLGRLHADATDASVICLRLGLIGWSLNEHRYLGQWLSDGDAGHLFTAALTAPVGYGVYIGVSANTRHHWDISRTCDELGYRPRDDSEALAASAGPPTEALCRLFDDTENTVPK